MTVDHWWKLNDRSSTQAPPGTTTSTSRARRPTATRAARSPSTTTASSSRPATSSETAGSPSRPSPTTRTASSGTSSRSSGTTSSSSSSSRSFSLIWFLLHKLLIGQRTRLEPIWSPHEASTKVMDFTGWIRKWRCCELNTKEGEGEVTNSAENESTEKVGKLCRTDGLLCDVVAGPYGASCPSCLWAPTGPWILQYLKNMITYRFLFRACPYLREKTTRLRRTAVMRMLSTTW